MEPLHCLYCPALLGPATKFSHVISDALGGRKKSRRISCDDCNNALSPVERTLSDALREYTGPLGVIQGSGSRAPAAQVNHPELGQLRLSDGLVKRSRTELKELDPGQVEITSGDVEQAAKQLAHQLRRYRRTPEDLISGRVKFDIKDEHKPPGTVHTNATAELGHVEHKRVLAKMAIELLAWHQPSLARLPIFQGLKNFVRHGNVLETPQIKFSIPGVVKGLLEEEQLPAFVHLVEIWSNKNQLNARVRLLGICEFLICLSQSWDDGPIQITHAVNPLEGKILYDSINYADGPLVNIAALQRPTQSGLNEWQLHLAELVQHRLFERGWHHAVHEVVEEWQKRNSDRLVSAIPELAEAIADIRMSFLEQTSYTPYIGAIDRNAILNLVKEEFERLLYKPEKK